jgi:hypothetical protein
MGTLSNNPDLTGNASEAARDLRQRAEEIIAHGKERVRDAASNVARRARKAYDASTERLSDIDDDVTEALARSPKRSVLIGFGLGCMVGMFFMRMLREHR